MTDGPQPFRAQYDAAQFRLDTWNQLKQMTARWDRLAKAGRDADDLPTQCLETLETLREIEIYFAFPGRRAVRQLLADAKRGHSGSLARRCERLVRSLIGDLYRRRDVSEVFQDELDAADAGSPDLVEQAGASNARPYFEVLIVDELGAERPQEIRKRMVGMRRDQDEFVYDVVVVTSFEDAVIAVLSNPNIQSVVVRYGFPFEATTENEMLRSELAIADLAGIDETASLSQTLGRVLKELRPELNLFLVTDEPLQNVTGLTGRAYRRIFYQQEDYLELHLSILRGIHDRYDTPFFNALREYSHRPTGVFHAMPISRGKSIEKSHWIRDMGDFYGENIFLAETSATTGGLDSLLSPHGPLKLAQEKAARAFGADKSYFVTNGTSTANKIVVQALLGPGDIALVSRDCHKSHHYALVLSGSYPVYMDPYPLTEFSMYGAVTLREIKKTLLSLKAAGKLDQVKLLLLTNCTFDGLVYHPEQVMQEVLAIKPDICFVWDEAWFGFARFSPIYRRRTAMASARTLEARLQSPGYREAYEASLAAVAGKALDDPAWLDEELLPDPDAARIRVYATQSTHKTLTSLRQGSMIHVYDEDFERLARESFEEAYMTHTSTSPNYQILASLDVGRRQVELEGYELVEQSVSLAMTLRERIEEHPDISQQFRVVKPRDLIPQEQRPSGLEAFYDADRGYSGLESAFRNDELVLDPTRVTVHVGETGMDGDTLRKYLMDKHDIQINKTSRNTLLFMLNIGTTRGAIAYLLEVLTNIARDLQNEREHQSELERELVQGRIDALTKQLPPLPNFSRFHERFRMGSTSEGDLREAFFLGRNDADCDFLRLDGSIEAAMTAGRELVAAGFVTPYPPGFPVLVPGQVVSEDILTYLKALDVKEIHGYRPELGLRVFRESVLATSDARPRPGASSTTISAEAEE